MESFNNQRKLLFDSLRRRGIGEQVIAAMSRVKRENFLPAEWYSYAYADEPLPIGYGQTISAPHMVAMMCQLLDVKHGLTVLEIGTGSGYHAAVLAELVDGGTVYSIERYEHMAEEARARLPSNVVVITGDGSLGYPKEAPYDRILVTCSAPDVPPPLLAQLQVGGRIVIPIGKGYQELFLVCKNTEIRKEAHGAVAFVLLIGAQGFHERDVR
ncbi:MAG: protein-L-isoaspartate(D-aspartate) O-methyltransferase [Euryarchaeota archaeon]|nr:protein-L-isoaspartate(D-aspartate) O-methyltransferase [Euryarchaeota archaeon]